MFINAYDIHHSGNDVFVTFGDDNVDINSRSDGATIIICVLLMNFWKHKALASQIHMSIV